MKSSVTKPAAAVEQCQVKSRNSLFQTVNLSNKYLKCNLLATVLNKGCKSLNLSNSFIQGNLSLVQKSQLIKLNMSNCKEKEISYGVVEDLLASCQSLERLSLKGLPLTSKRVALICKNSQTLQVLILDSSNHEEYWYQEIIKTCQVVKLHVWGHRIRTLNQGINQRNLKFWTDVADKICFGHTYKFGIGIEFLAIQ